MIEKEWLKEIRQECVRRQEHYDNLVVDAKEHDWTMIAYDMHSRWIAMKHFIEWIDEQLKD